MTADDLSCQYPSVGPNLEDAVRAAEAKLAEQRCDEQGAA
jgi:hypothetical protein